MLEPPQKPRKDPRPLPRGLRLGMRVRTTGSLAWTDSGEVCTKVGTAGNVEGYSDEKHVFVRFDRSVRGGQIFSAPMRFPAYFLERHPLEKTPLDSRTAAAGEGSSGSDSEEAAQNDPRHRWRGWELPARPKERPPELGTGMMYEVLGEKVVLRAAPSLAAPAQGCRLKGKKLELFEWDRTQLWRRHVCSGSWISSWVMMDHPKLGILLRPTGLPFQVKPHEPLCIAAHENDIDHIKAFLAARSDPNVLCAGDWTPLARAAAAGHCEAVVVLTRGGADVDWALEQLSANSVDHGLPGFQLLEAIKGRATFNTMQQLATALQGVPLKDPSAFVDFLRYHKLTHLSAKLFGGEQGTPLLGEDATQVPPMTYVIKTTEGAIRREPKANAEVIGTRAKGTTVELHEFDATGCWRRIKDERSDGWMPIFSELLEPLGTGKTDE